MKFDITELNQNLLIKLYKGILKPRMIEEKMLILLRQGKFQNGFRNRAGSNFSWRNYGLRF